MKTNAENVIWSGRPSQFLNIWNYLVCFLLVIAIIAGAFLVGVPLLAILAIFPVCWVLWKYLILRCRVYELTNERLRLYEGVLNQQIGEVELYRVKDTNITRPFWLRLCRLSNIKADTSDRTHPIVTLEAVRDGLNVRELLRKQVESLRDKKRVREVDFDGSGDGDELEFEG